MELAVSSAAYDAAPAVVGNRAPGSGFVAPAVDAAHSWPVPSITRSRTLYVAS